MQLVGLDQVLRLAARAVDLLVEMLGPSDQVGDDIAAVGSHRRGVDAADHGALPAPGFRRVGKSRMAAFAGASSVRSFAAMANTARPANATNVNHHCPLTL